MKKIGIFAALAAAVCGFLVYSWMNSVEARVSGGTSAPEIETVQIIKAAADIAPYEEITDEMLCLEAFPRDYLPQGACTDMDEVLGLCSVRQISAGEIIYAGSLSSLEEAGASLSYRIPQGMRAMTVAVDDITGVAGYITQGDLVDILAYYSTPVYPADAGDAIGQEDEDYIPEDNRIYTSSQEHYFEASDVSVNLLEAIEVLAVDTVFYENKETYTSLTLALTPDECSKLNLMQWRENTTLAVALRSRDDRSEGSGYTCVLSEVPG